MDEQHTSFNTQVYLESASGGAALIPAVLLQTIHTSLHNVHATTAGDSSALFRAGRTFRATTQHPPGPRESADKPAAASGNPLQLVWSSQFYGLGIF